MKKATKIGSGLGKLGHQWDIKSTRDEVDIDDGVKDFGFFFLHTRNHSERASTSQFLWLFITRRGFDCHLGADSKERSYIFYKRKTSFFDENK